jgi:hypothetical protein
MQDAAGTQIYATLQPDLRLDQTGKHGKMEVAHHALT